MKHFYKFSAIVLALAIWGFHPPSEKTLAPMNNSPADSHSSEQSQITIDKDPIIDKKTPVSLENYPFDSLFSDRSRAVLNNELNANYCDQIYARLKEELPCVDGEMGNAIRALAEFTVYKELPKKFHDSATFGETPPDNLSLKIFYWLLIRDASPEDPEVSMLFSEIFRQLPSKSLARFCFASLYCEYGKNYFDTFGKSMLDYAESGKLAEPDFSPCFWEIVYHYRRKFRDRMYPKLARIGMMEGKVDPWLRAVFNIDYCVQRAWAIRGGGWAHTVTPLGRKGFIEYLAQARIFYAEAVKLNPNHIAPYLFGITIAMGSGSPVEALDMFGEVMKLRPENNSAYTRLSLALTPRWCGSHEAIYKFAMAAMDTEWYESSVPSFGFCSLGRIAWDVPHGRWQNIYRIPEVIEKGDKLFAERLNSERGQERVRNKIILKQKILFAMASLRYDLAMETMVELGGINEFRRLISSWDGFGVAWIPGIPVYEDMATKYQLMTGEHGEKLREIELIALDGDENMARNMLVKMMEETNFSPTERRFLNKIKSALTQQ